MKTKTSLCVMLFFNLGLAFAQITPTPAPSGFATASANVRIFPSSDPQSEEMISINKQALSNLLISANNRVTNPGLPDFVVHQGFYLSTDGGTTWTGSDDLPNFGTSGNDNSTHGDPATACDASGREYIATIDDAGSSYLIQTTTNFGASWSNQIFGIPVADTITSEGFDKDMTFAFDEMPTSPHANTLYTAWTVFPDIFASFSFIDFNQSTDGGSTFSDPISLTTTTTGSIAATGSVVVTGPNGEIYVCWANRTFPPGITSMKVNGIGFSESTDGGTSFSTATVASTVTGKDADLRRDEFTPFAGTSVFFYPSMAVDKSCGTYNGRIYIAFPNQDPTDTGKTDIMVIYSDNASTWSTPAIVNITDGIQNWMPTIAVDDQTGLVNVIYYSLDNTSITNSADTYVAYSTDGGGTWQNIQASDVAHIHGPVDNTEFRAGYCGEYIGLASYGGHSYAVWHDNRPIPPSSSAGPWNLYFSRIDYNLPLLSSSSTNLAINNPTITNTQTFQAADNIQVANANPVEITSTGVVKIVAGEGILFNPGFTADANSYLDAWIQDITACNTPGAPSYLKGPTPPNNDTIISSAINTNNLVLSCYPNPTSEYITIILNGDIDNATTLIVKDIEGRALYTTSASVLYNNGTRFIYDASSLASGIYMYSVSSGKGNISGKFVKE